MAQAQAAVFYYDDGVTELGRLGEANRESVTLDQIPLDAQHAVLSAEDRTFYEHGGFSPRGILRALWNNVSSSSTQGGSTITQQYAKNAYLSDERRIQRIACGGPVQGQRHDAGARDGCQQAVWIHDHILKMP